MEERIDMNPQKPITGYQWWYWRRGLRSSSMERFDGRREDDLPFNSVIRSARWRALKETRISVGQVDGKNGRAGKEGRT